MSDQKAVIGTRIGSAAPRPSSTKSAYNAVALVEYYDKRRKRTAEEQHEQFKESVKRRHENEAAELQRLYDAIARLSRREVFVFEQKFAGTNWAEISTARLLAGEKIRSETYVASVDYSVPVMRFLDIDAVGLATIATMFAVNTADITETGGD